LAENCEFFLPHPCLTPPFRGNPSEFPDETWRTKTRGMGLLCGENCMILTSTVFDRSTRVTDRRTDRRTDEQTDGRNCDSICALSIYAVARKNCSTAAESHILNVAHLSPQTTVHTRDILRWWHKSYLISYKSFSWTSFPHQTEHSSLQLYSAQKKT